MVYFDTIDWVPQTGASLVEAAALLGYSGVVLNEPLTAPLPKSREDYKNLKSSIVKQRVLLKNSSRVNLCRGTFPILSRIPPASRGGVDKNEILQVTRATVAISNPSQIPFLNGLAKRHIYDLIAVTPQNDASWVALIAQGDFDIVSLDLTSSRLSFLLRRNQLLQLVGKNIFFEIRFNEALLDTQCRRHLLTNVQQLIRFVPHHHIIFSSGATKDLNLRAPADIIAFARLLGITESPKKVIAENVRDSIYRAGVRQTAGGVIGLISKEF